MRILKVTWNINTQEKLLVDIVIQILPCLIEHLNSQFIYIKLPSTLKLMLDISRRIHL